MKTEGGFLITQIKQVGGRLFDKLLATAGVEAFNGAQGRILYVLWQGDQIPIIELAHKTGLAKTTLTSMLDRMEEADLIARVTDPADRRQTRIALTDTARQLSGAYDAVSEQMNAVYYAGFTEEEVAQFERTLRRVLTNLQDKENAL